MNGPVFYDYQADSIRGAGKFGYVLCDIIDDPESTDPGHSTRIIDFDVAETGFRTRAEAVAAGVIRCHMIAENSGYSYKPLVRITYQD